MTTAQTLNDLRTKQVAHRDRLEAIAERRANVTEQIDYLALVIARLPVCGFTVAQAQSLDLLGRELVKRAGYVMEHVA